MTLTDVRQSPLEQRIAQLYANDSQFADARPNEAVAVAVNEPGLRLPQIVRTVMESYADRPALGQRAVRYVEDPKTGRTSAELLPRFDTVTYRETWDRARAIAAALTGDPVRPGDRVCVLGFASIDYTVIDLALVPLGAVALPLSAAASHAQLRPIVAEAAPTVIAASVNLLDDAVELVLADPSSKRLIVFDYHPQIDDQREAFEAARTRLTKAGSPVVVETLAAVLDRGRSLPLPEFASDEPDPLALLIYTSGSTGAPKGAMYSERRVAGLWLWSTIALLVNRGSVVAPSIVLSFLPMSHVMGRISLYGALCSGGTVCFVARSDLSTLLDDLALVRPTQLGFVPRIWEMLFQHFRSQLHRRSTAGTEPAEVLAEIRQNVLGGRVVSAATGSAPISDELRAWVESLVEVSLLEGYSTTEIGPVLVNGRVARPPVIDYKLVDVPDLGYFRTDRPHPRGELAVRSTVAFSGYYQRPEDTAGVFDADGYYRTGDIFAEIEPDHLVYLDRRNFVFKLSQGEFVAVSKLEAVFIESPLVRQIYVYGNSTRPYLLAVVVPSEDALARGGDDVESLKPAISQSLRDIAKAAGLQSYELPRDFIVETTPFSPENRLLTDIRKPARPKLHERYSPRLEQLYNELARAEAEELGALRQAADRPVLETIIRVTRALLGTSAGDLRPDVRFTDLGGDSLSALTFANLLGDIFGVAVSVGVIVSPANDLRGIADHVEALRTSGARCPAAAVVHGPDATEIRASDLALDKFLDADLLTAAPHLPGPSGEVRTVLLTGATGFLGRYLALEWLARLSEIGGKLICLVRAKDDTAARQRLDSTFDSGDGQLLAHYSALAADHLEVLAADKGEPNLGLDQRAWQRLADTVDLIIDPAALVNHVLSYDQLFGPNVVGTAELIRLALTTRLKSYTYVSTVAVGHGVDPSAFTEYADIRQASPMREVCDSYANGYSGSKWAGEVLLREAHDLCGLPVSVFRCDMIMTDTRYAGQLNLPDVVTRMMLSLVATGVAPGSFYELDAEGCRQRSHFDGLPVDFVAEAITTIGTRVVSGFDTYHVVNPHDDGISLDTYVDWLVQAGHRIERIPCYDTWLRRFEGALRALPEHQRQHSLLPLLHNHRRPLPPVQGAMASTERFRAAVRNAKIPPDKDIPRITPPNILKYVSDLQMLGLL